MTGAPPPRWVPLGDVAEIQGGIQKQSRRRPVANKYPFLRVANVARGTLMLDEVHEVELFTGELERFRLQEGDLLVVEGNGSPSQIGRAAMWRGAIPDCVHQNHLIRVRPGSKLLPRYLELAWNSPAVAGAVQLVASSTSGLYTLSTAKLRSINVPLVPLAEQQRIVEILEDHLSRLDAAVGYLTTAEQRLAQLPHVAERTLISASDVPPVPFESVFAPVSDGGRRVAQKDYLASGPVPVVDQGDGLIGGFTSLDDAYSGPLPVIVFGDHTRRAKYIDFRFAVGAQGVKLLRVRRGVAPRYGYYLVRSASLPSRGYGRHYAMLRSLTFPVPSLERQAAVVRELDAINEAASDTAAGLAALEKRRSTLRQAVLGAAFSGRLTGGASGPDLAEELAAASGVPTA